jgi:CBS domain-containing protein
MASRAAAKAEIDTKPAPARPVGAAQRRVAEIMSRPVLSVSGTDSLATALALLVGSGLRHLVVIGDAGECLGVLPDRAIVAVWAQDPAVLDRVRVRQVLAAVAPTVTPDDSVSSAAVIMHRFTVDAVAAVDSEGAVVGVLTTTDLIALLSEAGGPGDAAANDLTPQKEESCMP